MQYAMYQGKICPGNDCPGDIFPLSLTQFLPNLLNLILGGQNVFEYNFKEPKFLDTNTSLVAPVALAHRLQHLTTCLIQNGQWGLKRG